MRLASGDRMAMIRPALVGEIFFGRGIGVLYRVAAWLPVVGRQRFESVWSRVSLDIYEHARRGVDQWLLLGGRMTRPRPRPSRAADLSSAR